MKNIFEIVQEVLLSADKYQSEDNNLLKAKVYSDIMMMDEELLSLLLSNERIKEEFFTKVKDTLVFDKQKFAWLIESKEFLPDSYTRYSNKIGLTSNGNFISQKNDVVLDFPYKDCYLQGGQDKEDQKREEIFYHETIASDEVTRMLAPKVFTNAKRYTKEGIEENIEFKDDDNLIIKGNNLIALSSLLKRYEGKVKLIYIDPPYNTGSDSFGYNDSFNHSTWLTFMKNRLDISKDLLSDNGLIFIQCDDNEEAYLKVLCDSIFGNDNFINIITIKTKIGGVSGSSEGKSLKDTTEFILVYAKNKQQIELNPVYVKTPLYDYIQEYKDSGKSWKYTSIITKLEGKKLIKSNGEYEIYSYDSFQSMSVLEYARKEGISEKEVYEQYADRIFRTTNAQSSIRQKVMDETSNVKNEIVSIEYVPIKGKNKDKKIEVLYKGSKRNMFMFLSDMVTSDNGTFSYLEKITTLWEDIQYNNLAKEGEVDFTNGKKPELILQRIIELSTNEDDIVLDYFAGSGTTAAVAHKMDRQYIGIEQMDYINDLTLTRLNKVLHGDSSGVSKIVNWQGGGSFVYCELLENSKELIDEIQNATDATITDMRKFHSKKLIEIKVLKA
jgi:adenine-specific DNA-methyltransferase